MLECFVSCQSLLESQDSSQWEKGIEESSRGIDMCRDGNLSVSNSNEVAMVLHLTRAKLMWKLVRNISCLQFSIMFFTSDLYKT